MNDRNNPARVLLTVSALISLAGCASRTASNADTNQYVAPAEATGGPDQSFTQSPNDPYSPAYIQVSSSNFTTSPSSAPQIANLSLFGLVEGSASGFGNDPSENLRQVSFSVEGGDTDPSISADGSRVYFSSTAHRATPDIYVKSIDGRALTQLTNDPGSDIMPAVSPDGSRVAFVSDRSGSWDLYVMNASGGQAVQITSDATHELHPTWSPDGRSLAFCKLGEVSGRWEIWTTDAEQAGVQKFLTLGLFPDWHPTAGRILFQRSRDRGDRLFSVWTLDYTKGEATNLTEIASNPTEALINPKWSPDGEYVAFASVPNPSASPWDSAPPSADIWIMNVRGGGLSNLTGGQFANLMPTWGPNHSIFFVSNRGGQENLWSVNPETAMAAALNRGSRTAQSGAGAMPAQRAMKPASMHQTDRTVPMQPPAHSNAPATVMKPSKPMPQQASASPSATPAPAQTEPDPLPEMANVPNDDQDH